MSSAIVVGSGPNGLACAATLASRGVEVTVIEAAEAIGGAARSSELTVPGLLHDECSAFHPMAVSSPAVSSLELERHGLEWCWPEVDLAHPLEGGRGAAMLRSLEETATGLGEGGRAWERVFGPSAKGYDALSEDIYRPLIHFPRHPLRLARFGMASALPASVLARALGTPEAAALFGGVAAHSFNRLDRPLSAAIGMALVSVGHAYGWPVAKGGSVALAEAWASVIRANGGKIETGRRVRSLAELPEADAVVLDLSPRGVLELAGDRLPDRVARAYRRFKYGPAAFKVDLAVEGGVPWAYEPARRAGTVHLGGTFEEMAAAERQNNRGRLPERPFVLVGQQYLADPGRSKGDLHPVWAYAHVPRGYTGDATDTVLDQIERFAPGLRERIVAVSTRTPADIEAANPNLVEGDIATGANGLVQLLLRPRITPVPYFTGIPGVFICSAATPPGAGAHGICGFNAAEAVMKTL